MSAAVRSVLTKSSETNLLCQDLRNIPNHVFGDHSNCRLEYCTRKDSGEENLLLLLQSTPVLEEIRKHIDFLVRKENQPTKNVPLTPVVRDGLAYNEGPSWHQKENCMQPTPLLNKFSRKRENKRLYKNNNKSVKRRRITHDESGEKDYETNAAKSISTRTRFGERKNNNKLQLENVE
ncbi:hypothetical protein FQR65_LT02213 [Abscondita terminalis]|nr:hypothetical protein FQR65_LT02213 [Abscondita terminalis]